MGAVRQGQACSAGQTLNTHRSKCPDLPYWEGFLLTGLAGRQCEHSRTHCLLLQWHFTGRYWRQLPLASLTHHGFPPPLRNGVQRGFIFFVGIQTGTIDRDTRPDAFWVGTSLYVFFSMACISVEGKWIYLAQPLDFVCLFICLHLFPSFMLLMYFHFISKCSALHRY